MRRRSLVESSTRLVEREGYASVRADELRSFFDMIVEKHGSLYIIKFMENIDALAPAEATALGKLGAFLDGSVLVVGDRCRTGRLRHSTAFTRHGVTCISGESLEEALHGRIRKRAARFVSDRSEIDGHELQRLRRLYGLSMRRLAEHVGISKDSILRYESRSGSVTPENLKKLEGFFGSGLDRGLQAGAAMPARYSAFMNTGMKAARLDMDPFATVIKGRARYETGREANYRTMRKWAVLYRALNDLLGDYQFFVTAKKRRGSAIEGVPLIAREELEAACGEEGLRELIYENSKY